MLILNNDEIDSLLSVEITLRVLEKAYRELAAGRAANRPRTDLYLPSTTENGVYAFKSMEAGLVDPPVAALRLNSEVIRWSERGGRTIQEKAPLAPGGKWVGLILLFSAQTGEPLAIMPDGVIQRLRVAASSALAARYLARRDARVLGILGSGWQAGAHVPAMCAVREIKKVRIYSPTESHRELFAAEMAKKVASEVEAVADPEAAARGADILVAATNSISRVVPPAWVRPGVHLTCVKDSELGEETIRKAERVVIHSRKFAPENYVAGLDGKIEAHDPLECLSGGEAPPPAPPRAPFWVSNPELKDLIGGKVSGRGAPDEITCFVNNIGLGLQFAALGAAVWAEAGAKGIGREIPTEWFLESVHP